MKCELKISYWWKRSDGKRIKPEHKEALQESAMERITYMMNKNSSYSCYLQGKLCDNIHMTDRDPPAGVEYHGGWNVEKIA